MNKDELKALIEPHFYDDLYEDSYKTIAQNPKTLLTHNRFDIAFKLLFLENMGYDVSFAKEIYKEHIRALSLNTFKEPGDKSKKSIDDFISAFKTTYKNIQDNGFDNNKTLVVLCKNNTIANGAHRIASAIFLNQNIEAVRLNTLTHCYDYEFFYKRGVSANILDMVANTFVKYSTNIHIAFLWPIAKHSPKTKDKINKIIPNIVYKKSIKLNHNGAHNLLSQIYYKEKWLGDISNNFKGVKNKLVECFKHFDEFEVVAFRANSLEAVLDIKNKIRAEFGVGKHSVHITDTKDEAMRVANVVFNDNSLHFLNYSKPNKYLSTHTKIAQIKEFVKINNLQIDKLLIDSSMVLSCYGLRVANDIDYLYFDNSAIKTNIDGINNHDEDLKYHKKSKNELIFNMENYFYFNDIKFISFDNLYKMKQNRNESKDKNDCKMMQALIQNNYLKKLIFKLKGKWLYFMVAQRANLMSVLKTIGLYDVLKRLIRGSNEQK